MPIPLVSEQDFEREVLRAQLPVLVDLYADWCQPCKQLAQLLRMQHAVPVDVRDASAYGRYRIPGAVHIAKDDVMTRLMELAPNDGRLRVLYGRTTDEAKELAEKVRAAGIDVAFLVG